MISRRSPLGNVLAAGAALLVVTGSAGCSHDAKGGPGGGSSARAPGAFPVEVQTVGTRPVEYTVNAVGSVEAFEIVQISARVPGAVERVRFREGERVRAGDVLVEIEPERYRLAADEARAAAEKAEAALAEAEAGYDRRAGANEKNAGLIPGEELDAWRTRVRTARAEVASQKAAVELAERNARDAQATAPFAGTVQSRNVQTGQYVQPGTLLSTLVRRDPLLLRFQVPEGDAARLSTGLVARFRVRNLDRQWTARLTHVAESADLTSRMVAVTAQVIEDDERLRPGAFAEVSIPVGSSKDAIVIPETAVRPSERGFLAYVVDGGTARERVLSLGLRTPDGQVEVREGLAPAESLVVRGAEALSEGAAVRVAARTEDPAAVPGAAATAADGATDGGKGTS